MSQTNRQKAHQPEDNQKKKLFTPDCGRLSPKATGANRVLVNPEEKDVADSQIDIGKVLEKVKVRTTQLKSIEGTKRTKCTLSSYPPPKKGVRYFFLIK